MAKTTNSRLTQAGTMDEVIDQTASSFLSADTSLPGTPNRCGSTTLNPASTTRSANARTFGVMPGISAMTTTAGPVPLRNTSRDFPSWVNVPLSKVERSVTART